MVSRIVESVTGADGVRTSFLTMVDYRAGTITIQVNGQQIVPADVSAPGGREFTLSNPPHDGSEIYARYTSV